jgi:iron complex transport system substrate-binding protein
MTAVTGSPLAVAPKRVVSLLAAATELLCELGAEGWLVGRSHECDHPSSVTRLPAVSRPTFDITGSSAEIDARVRQRLEAGKPLYEVDSRLLSELAPDIIITQTHCEVCAVGPGALPHSAPVMSRRPVVSLGASTANGVLDDFLQVARVLGLAEQGQALVKRLKARLDAVAAATAKVRRPTVVCLEWVDPIFPMSNWMPELVERAGGTPLLGAQGRHSTTTPWDAVRTSDPEVLIVAPCGFGLARAIAETDALARKPGFGALRAVRSGRVFAADGNLYFNRSSPGLFETVDLLAEMLHPETFAPNHQGAAWVCWSSSSAGSSRPR